MTIAPTRSQSLRAAARLAAGGQWAVANERFSQGSGTPDVAPRAGPKSTGLTLDGTSFCHHGQSGGPHPRPPYHEAPRLRRPSPPYHGALQSPRPPNPLPQAGEGSQSGYDRGEGRQAVQLATHVERSDASPACWPQRVRGVADSQGTPAWSPDRQL